MEKKRLRGNRSDHTVGCILKKVIDCNCTIAIFLLLAAEACFTNYFPVVSVEICKHEKDTLRHYHINLVGILFLCEDAFELLTDENVVMFGLIMSKLNSVRIGKLNRATRDRRSSQRPARRQAGRGGWRRIIMVIQSGKSNAEVLYNLFPKRLEQKGVSLSETSLDGQRHLWNTVRTCLGTIFFPCEIKLISVILL